MAIAEQIRATGADAIEARETRRIEVALLPTLPIHAGASMRLYTSELLAALNGAPDVAGQVHWPAFGAEAAGRWKARWIRYVEYPRWCRRLSADLYHITDHGNAQLLLALPAGRTVVTCHDLYPVAVARGRVKFPGAEKRLAMTPTAARLGFLSKAGAIMAVSKHTLQECRDLLGIKPQKLFLAYYGISSSFRAGFHGESPDCFRARYDIRPEELLLLHVGSNDPRKNLLGVFRVAAVLRETYGMDVRLVKVGSSFGPREIQTIRSLSLTDAISELGSLSAANTSLAYRASDVLLYPSWHEGFCRPVAEAMACGTPVVASHRGAIPEVLPEPRLLFDPQDVQGMARRIHQITESSDLRQELAQRGKLAAHRFTWEAHGEAVLEAYRAVLPRWF